DTQNVNFTSYNNSFVILFCRRKAFSHIWYGEINQINGKGRTFLNLFKISVEDMDALRRRHFLDQQSFFPKGYFYRRAYLIRTFSRCFKRCTYTAVSISNINVLQVPQSFNNMRPDASTSDKNSGARDAIFTESK